CRPGWAEAVPPVLAVRRDLHLRPVGIKVPDAWRGVAPIIAIRLDADMDPIVAARALAGMALWIGGRRVVAAQSDEMVDVAGVRSKLDIEASEGRINAARKPRVQMAAGVLSQVGGHFDRAPAT